MTAVIAEGWPGQQPLTPAGAQCAAAVPWTGYAAACMPLIGGLLETPLLSLSFKDQGQIGQEQQQVNGPLDKIGAGAGKCQRAHC